MFLVSGGAKRCRKDSALKLRRANPEQTSLNSIYETVVSKTHKSCHWLFELFSFSELYVYFLFRFQLA